ncbi:hypothetical protein G647_01417 [Cladophialophora carrionii CBS 160.54]|uniref:Transcription factor domain-containing protein n=1 Tax=Cladophialophora carrionii CBS 160.54 TaxID=1279043 RepID=V9DQ16_9EURO|nr:uncharacterized protein G647_01417 [Cladophialophora carrionii CBS 160.54]ETI28965.1 hypothetical protein G647_01417 [Cladophialophora carrionii CBS 160.54]
MPELYKARWKLVDDVPPVAMAPVTDLFQLYCRDEISFQAILFDAASHRSALQGKPAPLEYENRLLRAIRSNLHTAKIGVILATAVLCNIKCMDGSGGSSHWLGLKEMINMRGGLCAFKRDHLLFTKLVWSFLALPGPLTGFDFASDLDRGVQDLNDLVRSRQKAIVNLLPTSEEDMDRLTDSRRIKAFKSSKLRSLLQPRSLEHPTERNCRIAVILFLTSALMLYGDFDSGTDFFIENISRHLQEVDDNASLSPPHLLWFIARLSSMHSTGDRYAQIWVGVIRMSTAFHRLAAAAQDKAEMLLFTSLEMPETFDNIPVRWRLGGELRIDAEDVHQSMQDRSVPAECFCELLWFTEPPSE